MKRMASLALVLALLTALFTGCKKQSTASESKQSDTTEPTGCLCAGGCLQGGLKSPSRAA